MALEKGTSAENRGSGKRRKIAPSEDGSNASEGEPCDLMSLCEGDQRLESTAEVAKKRLKVAKKQFRDRVGKLRTIMKFGMNVEERMCEVFGIVAKEMMQDFMDDIWKGQESANGDKTIEIRST
ncbi:hypothetical protein RUM43_006721 [Polyplax serrata]|uniref:Uncharacterized protein n=1 Tax=Polyplax serrata TaxID=468196 RepID=A0AAN8S455_POLSC